MPARRPSLRIAALGVLTAVALVLTGCSGDDDAPTGGGSGPKSDDVEVPVLDQTWTAKGSGYASPVLTDDAAVLVGDKVVRTLDPQTGEDVSKVPLPQGADVCQHSDQLDDGVIGLLLQIGRGDSDGRCTTLMAVDTEAGEVLWTGSLPKERDYYQGLDVAVGEGVLVATAFCDEVSRFDLRTGRLLGDPIAPRDRKCANDATTDGQVVLVLADPETSDTPEGISGLIPASNEPAAFELYDVGTGKRLWRHPIESGIAAGVVSVVSTKPTILTTTEHGLTVQRIWSKKGKPGPYVGLMPDEDGGATVIGQSDGVLVLTYGAGASDGAPDQPVLFGYDVRTGEELWRLPVDAVSAGGFMSAPSAAVADGHLYLGAADGDDTVVQRYDLRTADPDSVQTLGTADGSAIAFAGGTLITDGGAGVGSGLAGYAVPPEGVDGTLEDLGLMTVGPAWTDDDIRPEDSALACQAVSDETLGLAGVDLRPLPRPADCHWDDSYRPDYLRRGFDVDVNVFGPGTDDNGDPITAAEAAQQFAATDQKAPQLRDDEVVTADGEPTVAWGGYRVADIGAYNGHPVAMTTVWRNVVIRVAAEQVVEINTLMPGAAPWAGLQDAVYEATAEIIDGLGGDAELPEAGAAGSSDDVSDVCTLLEDDATALVPDSTPSGQKPRGGQSVCAWTKGGDDLVVLAAAVPGAPDGTSADDRADDVASVLPAGGQPTKRMDGVPGAARWSRYRSVDYGSVTASTRVGNLVVWIDYTVPSGAPSADEMDDRVAALMRQVVAANT